MGAPGLSCYTPLVASCSSGGLVGSAFCVPDPLNVSVTGSLSLSLSRCLLRSLSLSFSAMHPILPCYLSHFDSFLLLLSSPIHAVNRLHFLLWLFHMVFNVSLKDKTQFVQLAHPLLAPFEQLVYWQCRQRSPTWSSKPIIITSVLHHAGGLSQRPEIRKGGTSRSVPVLAEGLRLEAHSRAHCIPLWLRADEKLSSAGWKLSFLLRLAHMSLH